jgi:hypothetical protein
MKSIARSNYCTFQENDLLHVRMHSRVIQLVIPKGIRRITIERPWLNAHDGELLKWRECAMPITNIQKDPRESIVVREGSEIEIASIYDDLTGPQTVADPRTPSWAIARRLYCEARDRFKPTADRLRIRHPWTNKSQAFQNRHTLPSLLALKVTAANEQKGAQVPDLVEKVKEASGDSAPANE